MTDVGMVAILVAFFALAAGLVAGCDRIIGSSGDRPQAVGLPPTQEDREGGVGEEDHAGLARVTAAAGPGRPQ